MSEDVRGMGEFGASGAQRSKPSLVFDPTNPPARDEAVASLLSAMEARDGATCDHSRAVGMWCARLAKSVGLSAEEQAYAKLAGTLHDVGKVATPTDILLKPGPLDDDEWETMRAHARIGAKMLERIPSLKEFAPVVRAHHERVDGRGYPDRVKGHAIPLVSRIISVADSFHAMISKRPYRGGHAGRASARRTSFGRGHAIRSADRRRDARHGATGRRASSASGTQRSLIALVHAARRARGLAVSCDDARETAAS